MTDFVGTGSPADRAILKLYVNLMEEVKVRVGCIERAVQGQTAFPGPIVREFCYVQLRILCELIALSCLVAHGDIPATRSRRIGRETSTQQIMDNLAKLRPHFYPFAIRETTAQASSPGPVRTLEILDPQPFPKEALLALYGRAHSKVHRGNVEKLLKSATPIDTDPNFPEIIAWAQKVMDQLGHHSITVSASGEKRLLCSLRTIDKDGRAQASFMTAMFPPLDGAAAFAPS